MVEKRMTRQEIKDLIDNNKCDCYDSLQTKKRAIEDRNDSIIRFGLGVLGAGILGASTYTSITDARESAGKNEYRMVAGNMVAGLVTGISTVLVSGYSLARIRDALEARRDIISKKKNFEDGVDCIDKLTYCLHRERWTLDSDERSRITINFDYKGRVVLE